MTDTTKNYSRLIVINIENKYNSFVVERLQLRINLQREPGRLHGSE